MKSLFCVCAIILLSCSKTKTKHANIEIIIKSSKSYQFDLKKEVFTVFYLSKPPTQIKFHLTNEEKSKIIDKYYSLDLDKIPGKIKIEDECMYMPKLYTILKVNTKNASQEIEIDSECDDFYFSNFQKANRVKKFLKFVGSILQSKPEIKNAPISDILYL